MVVSCFLLFILTSSSVFALSIDSAFLNATTSINYTTDDLYAYINGSGSSGQINFTGSWYKNNTRYLPILNYQSYNDEGRDFAFDLKRDNQGNLIATSYSNEAKLRKFNSSGSLLWNSSFECDYNSIPVTVDSGNNIYVLCQSNDNSELIIYKFNSSGTNILNLTYPLEDSLYSIHGIELDSSNNTYFSYLNGSYDVLVVKLNSTGSVLWNSSFPGAYDGYDNGDMELDNQSNVFVATRSYYNFSIIKWNSTGSLVWNVTYLANGAGYVRLGALTTDTNRSVIFSSSNSSGSALIVKYNSTGSQIWNLTYRRTPSKSDFIYSSVLINDTLYVTGRTNYQPYVGVIGLDKINVTSGTLIWNATVILGPATVSAEGRGVQVADNKVYIWSYVPGTYYGYGIENVSFITLEENFLFNSTAGPLRLASTVNNSNTESGETWKFCAYAKNQTAQTVETCSNTLTIFYPYLNLTSCQNLTIHDVVYMLNQSINSAGTCFTVMAENITINGEGFTINYSRSSHGVAVNNSLGFAGLIVRNAVIVQGSTTTSAHSIVNSGANATIANNTISTRGGNAYAILFANGSTNGVISNNTIITGNVESIYLKSANGISIFGNNITSDFMGIGLTSSSTNNSVVNNIISATASSSLGVYVASSYNNTVSNNNISIAGADSAGLQIALSSENNYFSANWLNITGSSSIKIDDINTKNNTFYSNQIIDNGWGQIYISAEGLNGTSIIDQSILNYSFTGDGSLMVFENTTYGKIDFLNLVNGSGSNLIGNQNSDIVFGNNSVFVNSTSNYGLNRSANVTLYNIGHRGFTNPMILKNGAVCEDCYNFTSLDADSVVFNVSSWSEYSIGEVSLESSSSGSSSSSDSGGSPLLRPRDEEFINGYKNKLYKNWRVSFNFNQKNYIFKVKDIYDTKIKFSISPNVEDTFLSIGQEMKLDVNNDGNLDLVVSLDSIDVSAQTYGAVIEMKYIESGLVMMSPSQSQQDDNQNNKNSNGSGAAISVFVIFVVVCVAAFALYRHINRVKALRGY